MVQRLPLLLLAFCNFKVVWDMSWVQSLIYLNHHCLLYFKIESTQYPCSLIFDSIQWPWAFASNPENFENWKRRSKADFKLFSVPSKKHNCIIRILKQTKFFCISIPLICLFCLIIIPIISTHIKKRRWNRISLSTSKWDINENAFGFHFCNLFFLT